jgi:tetratricopeptide (TPR) repeat protein
MCYYARHSNSRKIEHVIGKALAINPDYIPALTLRANVLLEQGNAQEALPVFARLVSAWKANPEIQQSEVDPSRTPLPNWTFDNEFLPNGLITQPYVQHTPDRPIYTSPYTHRFRIDEKEFELSYPEILNNMGKCHYDLGHAERAIQVFQEAWDQGLRTWLVLYNLARAYELLGDLHQAELFAIDALLLLRATPHVSTYGDLAALLEWRVNLWEKVGKPEFKPLDERVLALARERGEETVISSGIYERSETIGSELVSLELDQDVAKLVGLQSLHSSYV